MKAAETTRHNRKTAPLKESRKGGITYNQSYYSTGRSREYQWDFENAEYERHIDRVRALGRHLDLLDDPKVQQWLHQFTQLRQQWGSVTGREIELLEAEWEWREKERKANELLWAAEMYVRTGDKRYMYPDGVPATLTDDSEVDGKSDAGNGTGKSNDLQGQGHG